MKFILVTMLDGKERWINAAHIQDFGARRVTVKGIEVHEGTELVLNSRTLYVATPVEQVLAQLMRETNSQKE